MTPRGRLGSQLRGVSSFPEKNMEICFFLIIFSRGVGPEKLKLVWEHPKVVNIQGCLNHDLRGRVGPQWGQRARIFTFLQSGLDH